MPSQALDQLVLAGRGIDEIEPDRVLGHLFARDDDRGVRASGRWGRTPQAWRSDAAPRRGFDLRRHSWPDRRDPARKNGRAEAARVDA